MSWAAWELTLAFFTGHLITIYGLILQFPLFLKNDYGEGGGMAGPEKTEAGSSARSREGSMEGGGRHVLGLQMAFLPRPAYTFYPHPRPPLRRSAVLPVLPVPTVYVELGHVRVRLPAQDLGRSVRRLRHLLAR